MKPATTDSNRLFRMACFFEGSLLLVALVLGKIIDVNPFEHLLFSSSAFLIGIIGTIPLFIVFLGLFELRVNSMQEIRTLLLETLGPLLKNCNWADLFLLGAIAGVAEEILFRGTLQPWLENAWGANTGLVLSNVIFGLVHAVTPLYALLAGLVGIYLSLSMNYGDEKNLLTPIVIHGVYDLLAFLMIMRNSRSGAS